MDEAADDCEEFRHRGAWVAIAVCNDGIGGAVIWCGCRLASVCGGVGGDRAGLSLGIVGNHFRSSAVTPPPFDQK
jgi:hypothetical protein